jgi:hypothetical protein
VQREQAVLAVDRAEDAFALGDLEAADPRTAFDRLETQLLVAGDDHGAGNRRKVPCPGGTVRALTSSSIFLRMICR